MLIVCCSTRLHREEDRPQPLPRPEREDHRRCAKLLREGDWVCHTFPLLPIPASHNFPLSLLCTSTVESQRYLSNLPNTTVSHYKPSRLEILELDTDELVVVDPKSTRSFPTRCILVPALEDGWMNGRGSRIWERWLGLRFDTNSNTTIFHLDPPASVYNLDVFCRVLLSCACSFYQVGSMMCDLVRLIDR